MMITFLRAAAIGACLLVPFAAKAAEDGQSLAQSISPAVADVVSGGSWSADNQGGFYRGVLIMTPGASGFEAQFFVQWLSLPNDKSLPAVVKTVAVKEVNDLKLQVATVDMTDEESKDNEVTFVVSSYKVEEDKDVALFVKATTPGTYEMTKAPESAPDDGAPAPQNDAPQR